MRERSLLNVKDVFFRGSQLFETKSRYEKLALFFPKGSVLQFMFTSNFGYLVANWWRRI